jgi:hypothetical protein
MIINTGLYLPDFNSADELKQAIILAKENGAQGVAFYEGPGLTEDFKKVIIEAKQELN